MQRVDLESVTIELQQVVKAYGPVRALRGVSLKVDAGRALAVLGGNGAGKSTLLALLSTLTKPSAGIVSHGPLGTDVLEIRGQIGWLGHDALVYGELTGRENVRLAARLYGLDGERAFARMSERFMLAGFADRMVRTYSRGQRQRIAIARALVADPKLVLLDEPTTGLDKEAVARLGALVREECARGAYVVLVTHDAGFAARYCDDSVELERGKLAFQSARTAAPSASAATSALASE
jgi:ABC-type multidrug transport system ATPase subunit